MHDVISETVQRLEEDLIMMFNLVDTVSLTMDIWTDRTKRGFISITGHFGKRASLQSRILAVDRFHGAWELSKYVMLVPCFPTDKIWVELQGVILETVSLNITRW